MTLLYRCNYTLLKWRHMMIKLDGNDADQIRAPEVGLRYPNKVLGKGKLMVTIVERNGRFRCEMVIPS